MFIKKPFSAFIIEIFQSFRRLFVNLGRDGWPQEQIFLIFFHLVDFLPPKFFQFLHPIYNHANCFDMSHHFCYFKFLMFVYPTRAIEYISNFITHAGHTRTDMKSEVYTSWHTQLA